MTHNNDGELDWYRVDVSVEDMEPPEEECPQERRLWLAVLLRALRDACNDNSLKASLSARAWLLADEWQLHAVCRCAGVDPCVVRKVVLRLQQDGWRGLGHDEQPEQPTL